MVKVLATLKNEIKRFCNQTNLHGYKLIILPNRMLIERVFWFFICVFSIITTITLVMISWNNIQRDPIILVTDSTNLPISNYDFPAVTICSNSQISRKKLYSWARSIPNVNITELMEDMQLINFLIWYNYQTPSKSLMSKITRLQNIFDDNNVTVYDVLKKITYDCRSMLLKCFWKGLMVKCSYWFQYVITPDGVCCSFNYHAFKKNMYNRSDRKSKVLAPDQPQKMSTCGYHTGFIAVIKNDPSDYTATFIPLVGHRVKIHYPYNYPDWNINNILQPNGVISLVSISPTATFSLNDIKKLPISYRNCLYPEERNLLFFRRYSFHNCLVECRVNITRQMCGCLILYYFSDKFTSVNEKICNILDIPCLTNVRDLMRREIPYNNMTDKRLFKNDHLIKRCRCYEDCEIIMYSIEQDTTDFAINYRTYALHLFSGLNLENTSVLKIFFNDIVGTRNRRRMKFSWDTLIDIVYIYESASNKLGNKEFVTHMRATSISRYWDFRFGVYQALFFLSKKGLHKETQTVGKMILYSWTIYIAKILNAYNPYTVKLDYFGLLDYEE